MDIFTRQDFEKLTGNTPEPCISIYMPTIQAGQEGLQNPIRFKNRLREAETALEQMGLKRRDIDPMLQPARDMLDDFDWWQHQEAGLAVFISGEQFRRFRLPIRVAEMSIVGHAFHLVPLVELLNHTGVFYLLALDLNNLRLFRCNRYGMSEMPLSDVDIPTSLADALRFDDPQRQLQYHSETPGPRGGRTPLFHGQGSAADDRRRKKDILRFFQQVDRRLHTAFHSPEADLLLAGGDHLIALYRDANSYSHLLDAAVPVNPDGISDTALHARAMEAMRPRFEKPRSDALDTFSELSGTERTSADIDRIVSGAHNSRVDTLFVTPGRQRWGRYDPNRNAVQIHAEFEPGDQELLNFAAVRTLQNGGTVFAVDADGLPGEGPAAAVLRF